MGPRHRPCRRHRLAAGLVGSLLLTALAGATSAGAHPGHEKGAASGVGTGVQVNSPDGLAGFHRAVQWGDTGELDDQTADLVYAGTGCSPVNYVPIAQEIDGNIALVVGGENPEDPADQCPAATFFQKVRSAQEAGAIGFVQVPGLDADGEPQEPTPNATAVDTDIPALEVYRTPEVVEVLEAVIADETVNATLTDNIIELPDPLSDLPCEDGRAGLFACDGIDLLSFTPAADFDGEGQSDLWGWTDPETGDEYVVIGKTNGVAFFRVTEPTDPVYLGELPNPAVVEEIWHDIKVYEDHAFIVSESEPHGMTVFDLTRLRDVTGPRTYDRDAFYPLMSAAHNVEVNTETGYAYIVGGNAGLLVPDACLSGLHMVDISTPTEPTFAGCYLEEGGPGLAARSVGEEAEELSPVAYVHDAQCVVYDGPDERYTDREICFNAAERSVVIADVTDKLTPTTLGVTDYPMVGYTHQGWLTEDHRYLLVNDEGDEVDFGINSRTVVLDVTDLENPTVHTEHYHETRSITHNNYVVGDRVYQSNYTSGLRVLDTRPLDDPDDPRLAEEAFFDTFPTHGEPVFAGTWSNYPYFESGTIAVSGMDEGLFLLRLADDEDDEGTNEGESGVELTCVDCEVEVRAGEAGSATLEVHNTGEDTDTYDLAVTAAPDDWDVRVEPEAVEVDADRHEAVDVGIEVPSRTQAGTYTLEIIATSRADADVSDTAEIEVEVRRGAPSEPGPPDGDRPGNGGGNGPPPDAQGVSAGAAAPDSPRPAAAGWLVGLAVAAGLLGARPLSRRLTAVLSRR